MSSCVPLMLRPGYRETFPVPPQMLRESLGPDFCPESMTISFDTPDSRPDRKLPDPNLTPISIPVCIRAPYYFPKPGSQSPFSTRGEMPVSENEMVGSLIEGLFTSLATFIGDRSSFPLAVAYERDALLVMTTSRGRLFKIPRETKIKDVVAGARWPRQPNAPVFEDLRRMPRKWDDEIDGTELMMGWVIEVYVIIEDKLGAFVDRLETGFKEFGI